MTTFDAIVVGSGLVGASCAYELTRAGLRVVVLDRGELTSGTTASGEGNILVSDKQPGPELVLALRSRQRWSELADELESDMEFERKGGVVVATTDQAATDLLGLADRQRSCGVEAEVVTGDRVRDLEPHLTDALTAAVHYPQDAQVQPVLASAALLRRARQAGAQVRSRTELTAIHRDRTGRVTGAGTDRGPLTAPWVINAAGPWSPAVARLVGSDLPVRPRRGHILVTEPVPVLIRHKVYEADYVDTLVAEDDGTPQVSSVLEGTRAGTILIGASREFVGFDRTVDVQVVRRLARRAVRLYPRLARVNLLRVYVGFRPWTPDHLPIVGEDEQVPGLVHATGHEGAGIGLAPVTGELVRALVTATVPPVDARPFLPSRTSLKAVSHDG